MKSSFTKGESKLYRKRFFQWILKLFLTFNYSENIERYRKIIQQRIVAVKEEANRKYGNLVESIPLRLEQMLKQKKAEAEVEGNGDDVEKEEN